MTLKIEMFLYSIISTTECVQCGTKRKVNVATACYIGSIFYYLNCIDPLHMPNSNYKSREDDEIVYSSNAGDDFGTSAYSYR